MPPSPLRASPSAPSPPALPAFPPPAPPPPAPSALLIVRCYHRWRVQDGRRAAIVVFRELRVVPRNRIAIFHEPRVDLVLDALAHLLALHVEHLLLQVHQGLIVIGLVLRLHPLPPFQVGLQHGLRRRPRPLWLRHRAHPDKFQL